jgi:hypothetical protein
MELNRQEETGTIAEARDSLGQTTFSTSALSNLLFIAVALSPGLG